MCDTTFSILKDFVLLLLPFQESEQMYIEDKYDVDMYFKFKIIESDTNAGDVTFIPEDNAHGLIQLTIMKGARVRKTPPMRVGTYGRKSDVHGENTGLYILFEVEPMRIDGSLKYQVSIQFQIKGGE